MYGWYSKKQFENRFKHIADENIKHAHIYYKDMNDNIVEVTEVTITPQYGSLFDDAVSIGKLKSWHMATDKPINMIDDGESNTP